MNSTEVIAQAAQQFFLASTGCVLNTHDGDGLGVGSDSLNLGIARIERVCAPAYNTYCTHDGSGLGDGVHFFDLLFITLLNPL